MLEIDDLSKRYGAVRALDGASFTARRGRLVGFLGPNGAGKTTTMRCIFGLATPDSRHGPLGRRPRSTPRPGCGSGTCPSSAASTRGCASASSSRTSASTTACRGAVARTKAGEWLERFGLGGPGEVQARGPLARQPAAGPARHGARPRPGAARPRRAVQRPRPDRHRHDGRASCASGPRAGVGRRVLVAPARPRRGGLRGRRDHQPRAGRGRGRRSRSSRPAPGRRHLDVEVAGSGGAWLDVDQPPHGPRARRRPRAAARRRDASDLDGLLAAARAAGEVRRFSYEPPKLSELFMEAVNAPQPAAPTGQLLGGRRDEPPARDPPRRRPGDHRARPQPRLRPVARCSRSILMCVGFIVPSLLVDQATQSRARARRRGAARARGVRSWPTADAFDVERRAVAVPDEAAAGAALRDGRIDAALSVPRRPVDRGRPDRARGRAELAPGGRQPGRHRAAAPGLPPPSRRRSSRSSRRRPRTRRR